MMNKEDVLRKINEETYLLIHALDAQDLDVVERCIAARELLLKKLENAPLPEDQTALRTLQQTFETIHVQSVEKLKAFQQSVEQESRQNKAEQLEALQMQKVHNKYRQADVSGQSFDVKK